MRPTNELTRIQLRAATVADIADILPRTRALNAHEGIVVSDAELERALRKLLGDPSLGGVWLVQEKWATLGYAVVTFGYDLEFAGRNAWLTEIWIDEAARGRGAASAALALLDEILADHGVRALHLQVRPENPALRLYERNGFSRSPRLTLTRRLG